MKYISGEYTDVIMQEKLTKEVVTFTILHGFCDHTSYAHKLHALPYADIQSQGFDIQCMKIRE